MTENNAFQSIHEKDFDKSIQEENLIPNLRYNHFESMKLPYSIQNLVVDCDVTNSKIHSIKITGYSKLKTVKFNDSCFSTVSLIKIMNNRSLVSIDIGNECFSENNGSFTLQNCPSLEYLRFRENACRNFVECIMKGKKMVLPAVMCRSLRVKRDYNEE